MNVAMYLQYILLSCPNTGIIAALAELRLNVKGQAASWCLLADALHLILAVMSTAIDQPAGDN